MEAIIFLSIFKKSFFQLSYLHINQILKIKLWFRFAYFIYIFFCRWEALFKYSLGETELSLFWSLPSHKLPNLIDFVVDRRVIVPQIIGMLEIYELMSNLLCGLIFNWYAVVQGDIHMKYLITEHLVQSFSNVQQILQFFMQCIRLTLQEG